MNPRDIKRRANSIRRCFIEGEDIILEDGGQMLSQTPIEDIEEDELVKRVLDYWGLGEEDWIKGVM